MPPHYETVIVARTPNQNGPPKLEIVDKITAYKNISWADELVGDNLGSVSAEYSSIPPTIGERFIDLTKKPCELWIYREGILVQGGPILGIQTQGNILTIVSRGPLYYLNYMFVQEDYVADKDQYGIFRNLVDQWQNDDYGNFGLKTSNIGTSGVDRVIEFDKNELRNVRRELELLAANADGFDFYVDFSTQTLGDSATRDIVLTRKRGEDKSDYLVFDIRNLSDLRIWSSVSKEDVASWVRVLGTTYDHSHVSTRTNDALMQSMGKIGAVSHIDGVGLQVTNDRYADQMKELLSNYHIEIGGQQQGTTVFSTANVGPMDFGPGDTVRVTWDAGYGIIDETRVVNKKFVSVDETGTEKMNVHFR